ncbi:hypothetical protein, partial [Mesorhizobium sp.]|uniref:hypothetical protein n=1 Tax=Mesorhizobium sp. TaxID=1871066 RepID=UPI0025D80793
PDAVRAYGRRIIVAMPPKRGMSLPLSGWFKDPFIKITLSSFAYSQAAEPRASGSPHWLELRRDAGHLQGELSQQHLDERQCKERHVNHSVSST